MLKFNKCISIGELFTKNIYIEGLFKILSALGTKIWANLTFPILYGMSVREFLRHKFGQYVYGSPLTSAFQNWNQILKILSRSRDMSNYIFWCFLHIISRSFEMSRSFPRAMFGTIKYIFCEDVMHNYPVVFVLYE